MSLMKFVTDTGDTDLENMQGVVFAACAARKG